MNPIRRQLLFMALLIAAGLCMYSPAWAQPEPGSSNAHALLIGITGYQTFAPLKGAVNDVETMRQVLLTRFGFTTDHIKTLTNQEASRHKILSALEQLQKNTGADDTVYIHFSGYGSFVRTPSDNGSLKETILPYDARADKVADITMSELDQILNGFKSRSIILVLDASHSSSNNRLPKLCRSAAVDTRTALYNHIKSRQDGIASDDDHYLLLTASNSSQPALDAPIDGKYHGVLSYALSKTLLSTNVDASPKDLIAGIERELRRVQTQLGLTSMPEARIVGPADRINGPLFFAHAESGKGHAVKAAARVASLEVKQVAQGQALIVEGQTLGALPGSAWAIYPPGEINFEPGQAHAMAMVSDIQGADAIARVDPPESTIQDGSRAVAVAVPAPKGLPIRLLNMPAGRRAMLEKSLRDRLENIHFVDTNEFARYVIDQQGDRILISGADGLTTIGALSLTDDQTLAKELATLLSRSNNASGLVALDNPSSHVQVYARVANGQAGTSVVLAAAERLNPDKRGNSLSALVRIYELASNGKFEQASYEALLKNDQKTLEGEVLWRKEIMLHPNSREVIQIEPQKKGRYIAVVGLFREPQGQTWRQVIPIKDDPNQTVEINFDDKGIAGIGRDRMEPNRGVKLVANTKAPRVRIKQDGEARSSENSLQLEVKSTCDCYITIVDVDSEGGVNLLFPTEDKSPDFYPKGKVRRNEPVLLPDSLEPDNRAGFHFDYSDPPGIDTIRVFASTDLETAEVIRRSAKNPTKNLSFPNPGSGNGSTNQIQASNRSEAPIMVASAFDEVRSGLRRRGVKTVKNRPDAQNVRTKGIKNPDNPGAQAQVATADGIDGKFKVTPVSQQAPDWAATSLTVIVDP